MSEKLEELFSSSQIEKLDELIEIYKDKPGSLIPLLENCQEVLGFLPICVQQRIAEKSEIPSNKIYGVVTFYSFFTMKAKAKHRVQLCAGTACYIKGGKLLAEKIQKDYDIEFGNSTKDGRFTFDKTRCFGACGLAPVVVIDGTVYGKVTPKMLDEILELYK